MNIVYYPLDPIAEVYNQFNIMRVRDHCNTRNKNSMLLCSNNAPETKNQKIYRIPS